MAKKDQLTTCSPIPWNTVLKIITSLRTTKNYRFLLLISIGCFSGLRIKDILNLRWVDLLDKDLLEIRESKTSKLRRITINVLLKNIISEVYEILYKKSNPLKKEDYIFLNRHHTKPISVQYVNRALHLIFARYDIKSRNFSSHCLRKSFARRVWEKSGCTDAGLILVSSLFNHNNTVVTRRYIGLEDQQFADVYLNL